MSVLNPSDPNIKFIKSVFSQTSSIQKNTVTTAIRGDTGSIEEYRIDVVLNHLLFVGVERFLTSSLTLVPESKNGFYQSKSDFVVLEHNPVFAVPLISSMNFQVIESTLLINGSYGIPIVTLENDYPKLSVVDKLVISRCTEEFISKTTIILQNISQFEHPILSIRYIPIFGQSIKNVMICHRPLQHFQVPYFFFTACRYLENCALKEEGIFRLSGDSVQMKEIKELIQSGEEVNWVKYSIHSIANVLKSFFREMSGGVIQSFDIGILQSTIKCDNETNQNNTLQDLKHGLNKIYKPSVDVMNIFSHLLCKIIINSDVNMMNKKNLLICLSPSMKMPPSIMVPLLFNHDELYDGLKVDDILR
ncbi:Rho-GAP domain-containing protein [Entamoeba marina]